MRVQVKDFMSFPVITTTNESTVSEVKKLMNRNEIHAIPVIEYAKQLPAAHVTIRGIITASDLRSEMDDTSTAAEIMTSKVHVVHKNSSAQSAAKMMLKHSVHHLVVMDDGKIVGMISALDFTKLVAEHSLE